MDGLFEDLKQYWVLIAALGLAALLILGLLALPRLLARPEQQQATPVAARPGEPAVAVMANEGGGFTVTGTNWQANASVSLTLNTSGSDSSYWLNRVQTDGQGNFRQDFSWRPNMPAGENVSLVAVSGSDEARASFNLTPGTLDPTIPDLTATAQATVTFTPVAPTPQPMDTQAPTTTATATATAAATATSIPSPTPGSGGITCRVTADQLNLRRGPGLDHERVALLQENDLVRAVARDSDTAWLEVIAEGGQGGWVAAEYVDCGAESKGSLPVSEATPTPTPFTTPTPITFIAWRGEYFDNRSLRGMPVLIRDDKEINFDWGAGSPAPAVPNDDFSARWIRWLEFEEGRYDISLRADDGARLYIDNQLVIDVWNEGSLRTQLVTVELTGGQHFLQVEFYEVQGNASVSLWWERQEAISNWKGEYFANPWLAGTPSLVRDDEEIAFDWGMNAPVANLPADAFSARWTRTLPFEEGTYRFSVRVDDGARLFVDNELVLDMWTEGVARTGATEVKLSQGHHTLQLDYFEAVEKALISLSWERVIVITGWKGEYFSNRDLSGSPALVRDDKSVNFNWGTGAPAAGIPADDFSARWTREIAFDPGMYRFTARADDGVRLWIDGTLIIDEWHDGPGVYTREVALSQGSHAIQVEYYEGSGGAAMILEWGVILGATVAP